MSVDPYTVIASARARGVSDSVIARQLGLRDGHTGYGITRQDGERKPVVIVPAPMPERRPVREQPMAFGKLRRPAADMALAEMIKAAGAIRNEQCATTRDRLQNRQSTQWLIYDRARATMLQVAALYGFPEHTGVRSSLHAARDRLQGRFGEAAAENEKARQDAIMALVGRSPTSNP